MRFLKITMFLSLCWLALSLGSCSENNNATSQTNETTNTVAEAQAVLVKQEIAPPFQNLNVDFQTVKINPKKAQTVTFKSGTSIDIPADAFVDKNGQPVTGKMEIRFREFHTAAEILASGIPMMAKGKDGQNDWMQTAGMYEIQGSAKGEEIFVAPDKSLTVNLLSQVDGDYDFWSLDEETGTWNNIGLSKAASNPAIAEAKKGASAAAQELPRKPIEPVVFDKSKPALNFDVNYKALPELKDKRGIIWQYAGKNSKEDPANNDWVFSTNWDKASIEPMPEGGLCKLTLSNKKTTYSIPVCPSRQEKDMAQAKADYQKQFEIYKSKLMDLEERKAYIMQQAQYVRSMQVQGMGIFNCDILIRLRERGIPLMADFDFGEDIPKNIKSTVCVFLITGKGRSVVKLPPSAWDNFAFDPSDENSLVAVLPGNKIATFSQKDFDEQLQQLELARGATYTFKMKLEKQPLESLADVQKRVDEVRL